MHVISTHTKKMLGKCLTYHFHIFLPSKLLCKTSFSVFGESSEVLSKLQTRCKTSKPCGQPVVSSWKRYKCDCVPHITAAALNLQVILTGYKHGGRLKAPHPHPHPHPRSSVGLSVNYRQPTIRPRFPLSGQIQPNPPGPNLVYLMRNKWRHIWL